MQIITNVLGTMIKIIYDLFQNYGISILIFTILTKIILLPLSIMVQKNSIKMVKMYPEINKIKAANCGDSETISEKQYELYKKYKYNPFLDLIPLICQIVLLIGVINVIYSPFTYILNYSAQETEQIVEAYASEMNTDAEINDIQIKIINDMYNDRYEKIDNLENLNMSFMGIDLYKYPLSEKGNTLLIPFLAGLSALLMCIVQNKANVLQSEQSKTNKYGTTIFSVILSLYLGFFVPAATGLYWIFSNLFAIIQLFILNFFINPKKHIDYEDLEQSKEILQEAQKEFGKINTKEIKIREKQDYKRFFKYGNKDIVFYSEKSGFYKYYKDVLEYILNNSDVTVHYVTNDPNDIIFTLNNDKLLTYYIGKYKLISFMMKMDANVVVMTTPDLEKYHIKRSYVRKDTRYIYIPHDLNSANLGFEEKALNYFDDIFVSSPSLEKEQLEVNKLFNIQRNIIPFGSCVIDDLLRKMENGVQKNNSILIAPSWQKDNILDSCIDEILEQLLETDYKIIVRPHPQYIKHNALKVKEIKDKYNKYKNFYFEEDFSSNDTIFMANLIITDWSSIAFEFSFATKRPVLFINTEPKILNPNYKKIDTIPMDLEIRDKIGIQLEKTQLNEIKNSVDKLLNTNIENEIEKILPNYLYNPKQSGEVGGKYILKVNNYVEERRDKYEY